MCIHNRYTVKVKLLDGTIEELNYKGMDNTSYSAMIKIYRQARNTYNKKAISIKFYGVKLNGDMNLLFTKEFKENIKGNIDLNKDAVELMNNISKSITLLEQKKIHHENLIKALIKKENVLSHRIETISKSNFTKEEMIEEKLKIFDELETLRKDRRWHKNQLFAINKAMEDPNNGLIDLETLKKVFNNIKIRENKYEYLTEKVAKANKIYEEYFYASEKDLENKLKKFQKEYSNICIDRSQNKLMMYNKAYCFS